MDGHRLCHDCRMPPTLPPLPPSPAPSPSPPPTLFDRPVGCLDPLQLEQRAAIITMWKEGADRSTIAARIPCSLRTVGEWVRGWQRAHSLEDKERPAQSENPDWEMIDSIVALVEERKFITPKEIVAELQLPISARTVRRRLDEAGLHGRVARPVPMWTAEHIRKRLSFAEGYANWTEADWERVIFSDETHMELSPHGQMWVQRPVGAELEPDFVVSRKLHSGRVTLWGCFSAKEIGQAEVFVGEFDAVKYTDVLAHNLLPSARAFFPSGQWWFLQDNAPQHRAEHSRIWLHNHGIDCIDFPALSPDLNPIENLWADLKHRVERRHARTMEELEAGLREEWEATSPTLLASLAHSMPARIAAVIENKGHKTAY